VIYLCIYFVMIFVRLYMVKDMIQMSAKAYMKEVFLRVLIVGIASLLLPFLITCVQEDSVLRFLEVGFVSVISSLSFIWLVGMKGEEKIFVISFIKRKLSSKRYEQNSRK